MREKLQILLCFFFSALIISSLNAQQTISDDNRKLSIEERMIRLEEGQKSLEKRFDDLTLQMNNRFNDMNNRFNDMNNRFDDINSKFNWLYIMLSSIIALNGVVVGSVIWLARHEKPIGQRHFDQIIDRENELERQMRRLSDDVELIKTRLELTE